MNAFAVADLCLCGHLAPYHKFVSCMELACECPDYRPVDARPVAIVDFHYFGAMRGRARADCGHILLSVPVAAGIGVNEADRLMPGKIVADCPYCRHGWPRDDGPLCGPEWRGDYCPECGASACNGHAPYEGQRRQLRFGL